MALVALVSQLLLHRWLVTSEEDSRVVNLAGRQRMLSERIVKQAVQLWAETSVAERAQLANDLAESLDSWQAYHHALMKRDGSLELRGHNSLEVQRLYEELTPSFESMVRLTKTYTQAPSEAVADRLAAAQESFLLGMDTIVFQYDREARARVLLLEEAGAVLLVALLATMVFATLFVFRPAFKSLEAAFSQLTQYGERLESLVEERTKALVAETERHKGTIEQLKDANGLLERLALKDSLTGLGNRRYFDQALEHEWRRAARDGDFVALVLADIDDFKQYNDTLGHPAGDACLRAVGQALGHTVGRPGDTVARYGGEEFAFILSSTDAEGALRIAENARANIASLMLPHPASRAGPWVSLSFGVASIRATADALPALLIAQADHALYRAKHEGRARVEAFVPPPDDSAVVLLPRHG